MSNVTKSYLDGISEGRATLRILGGKDAKPEDIRSMFRSISLQHKNSRGFAYGALSDFVDFRKGEMDFWVNQVSKLGDKL